MEEVRVVHTFQTRPEEEVRFTVKEYKDRKYLDLRLWFQSPNDGRYYPTKKGLTLSLDYLGELKKGLESAGREASELAGHKRLNPVR